MALVDYLTDERIGELIGIHKIITEQERRRMSKRKEINGSRRLDIPLLADCDESFHIFIRESIDDPFDFTAALCVALQDGGRVNLMRCNGRHGSHKNIIENEWLEDACHVHIATSRYIQRGLNAEGFAQQTEDYFSVEGALVCLLNRCNIAYEGYGSL